MKKKFPKQVFVCYYEEGTIDEFFAVSEKLSDINVEIGERKTVAIYTFKELKTIEGKAIIE